MCKDQKKWFEKAIKRLDLKKMWKEIFFDGFDTYENYEKYGDVFVHTDKKKMSVEFSEDWFENLYDILEAQRKARETPDPTPEELDNKFLDECEEDVTKYLYDIRYSCEGHTSSPLANLIEDAVISIQSLIMKADNREW